MTEGPIKMALVYNSIDYPNEGLAEVRNELQGIFGDTGVHPPDVNESRIGGEPNVVLIAKFLKTALNEQVIELTDIGASRIGGYKEYWLMCDDIEDHPEIWRSE